MNIWLYLFLSLLLLGIFTFAGSLLGGALQQDRRER